MKKSHRKSDTESWFVVHGGVRSSFANGLQRGRLYEALELDPACSDERLIHRVEDDIATLSSIEKRAQGEAARKARVALSALRRLRKLLDDRRWRIEYDFRHGFTRAVERIRAADRGTGPALEELRRIWLRVHPDRALRAATQMKSAHPVALDAAAEFDPFHPVLSRLLLEQTEGASSAEDSLDAGSQEARLPEPAGWEGATPRKHIVWENGEVHWDDLTPLLEVYEVRQGERLLDERALFEDAEPRSFSARLDVVEVPVAAQPAAADAPETVDVSPREVPGLFVAEPGVFQVDSQEAKPPSLQAGPLSASEQRLEQALQEALQALTAEVQGALQHAEVVLFRAAEDLRVRTAAHHVEVESSLARLTASLAPLFAEPDPEPGTSAAILEEEAVEPPRAGVFLEAFAGALLAVCLGTCAVYLLLVSGGAERQLAKASSATPFEVSAQEE